MVVKRATGTERAYYELLPVLTLELVLCCSDIVERLAQCWFEKGRDSLRFQEWIESLFFQTVFLEEVIFSLRNLWPVCISA